MEEQNKQAGHEVFEDGFFKSNSLSSEGKMTPPANPKPIHNTVTSSLAVRITNNEVAL